MICMQRNGSRVYMYSFVMTMASHAAATASLWHQDAAASRIASTISRWSNWPRDVSTISSRMGIGRVEAAAAARAWTILNARWFVYLQSNVCGARLSRREYVRASLRCVCNFALNGNQQSLFVFFLVVFLLSHSTRTRLFLGQCGLARSAPHFLAYN